MNGQAPAVKIPSKMARRKQTLTRKILGFLRRENLHRIVGALLLLSTFSALALWRLEPEVGLAGWIWWSLVTLTTVGYGDITPSTIPGRAIGVMLMFFGIGVLSTLTATIASFFVERKLRRDRGMTQMSFEGHIILCHWNHRTEEILRELRRDSRTAESPVVLISSQDNKPVDDDDLYFIRGPVHEENLSKAGIQTATTVVIVGDSQLEETARDAQVVLATLTIESMNPDAYTIVELALSENVRHCERARADEIIVGDRFASHLLATAAVDHGLSKVVSELLSHGTGQDLERHPIAAEYADGTYFDMICGMKKARKGLPVAVQRGKEVVTNPPADYRLAAGDQVICIVGQRESAAVS